MERARDRGTTVVTLGPPQRQPLRGLQDLPDAVAFASDQEAWGWALEQAMRTNEVGLRAVVPADLDPRVRDLLHREGSVPTRTPLGLPTVATAPSATWRAAWVDGAYELHCLEGIGRTQGLVVRDADLAFVQQVLVASLTASWRRTRPWRWPSLRFSAATASLAEWDALKAASLPEMIAAVDTLDGDGVLTPRGHLIPGKPGDRGRLRTRRTTAALPAGRLARSRHRHLGMGFDRSHFAVIRHASAPRYELIELGERSNSGSTVLRTNDPAELDAELLRRI